MVVALVVAVSMSGGAMDLTLVAGEGVAAPAPVVAELETALAGAARRFEARDVDGVLAYVSDQYRTGPFTKLIFREQLVALYGLYGAVKTKIRIDEVRIVNGTAWVYSTGEVSGRLALGGTWMPLLSWRHELEVARRETVGWRLYGYQR